jgi:galactarate dehydratase
MTSDLKPLYIIKAHPSDNVAIIVNPDGLSAATQFADGLTLKERISQAHKVALGDLQRGDPVRRYGQIIGFAGASDRRGLVGARRRYRIAPAARP